MHGFMQRGNDECYIRNTPGLFTSLVNGRVDGLVYRV